MSAFSRSQLLGYLVVAIAAGSPGNYSQQGPKLVGLPPSGAAYYQGGSLALSADGNTAIVNSFGYGFIFVRLNGAWSQQAALSTGRPEVVTVAISADGNTAALGQSEENDQGGAYVFVRSGTSWSQQGPKLSGTGAVSALQGNFVALSGDGNTLFESSPDDNNRTGAVWVFTRTGGVWTQQGNKLVGSNSTPGTAQGVAMAPSMDGNTVAFRDGNSQVSSVWIFSRSKGVWSQQTKLSPSCFGNGLSLSADENTLLSGACLFQRTGSKWANTVDLTTLGAGDADDFALSANGSNIVDAVEYVQFASKPGYVALWQKVGGAWTIRHQYNGTGAVGSTQGTGVAISSNGDTMIESDVQDSNAVGAIWAFAAPELHTSLTHAGDFHRGEVGATYTIAVSNAGDREIFAQPSSAVNLVDRLPVGLTATALQGSGWNCTLATLSCTRQDGLGVGAEFPPIELTVDVAADAPASVTNAATASGGGSTWGNAIDLTTVTP